MHVWVCTWASIEVRGLHQAPYSVTFNLIIIVFKSVCMFVVCLSTYVQMPHRLEEGFRSLELQLAAVVTRSMWVLGTESLGHLPSP